MGDARAATSIPYHVCNDTASCKVFGYILDGYSYNYDEEGYPKGYIKDDDDVLPCNSLVTCTALGYSIEYYGIIYHDYWMSQIEGYNPSTSASVQWCHPNAYTVDARGDVYYLSGTYLSELDDYNGNPLCDSKAPSARR
ncbi:hypothetical protein HK101_001962 [Irineochytrium annulatum]|nr:hypothetical protein HK101_001962 [Irineochytrium annulatum]